jgi:Phage tail sheath protein subtilisin-like domain/Phage tail sheath C-terminal domain
MARSINSPGVQITETDLSNYQIIAGGTNVFIPGFASQGPTDEVQLITSITEFEQIYGAPTTPAERYFYYSSKEILNSTANLLTTRLPYGSGSGDGFASQYSALLYPVASGNNGFTVGQPRHITFDEATYTNMLQNNVTWSPISSIAGLTALSVTPGVSSITASNTTSAAAVTTVSQIDPSYTLTINPNLTSITLTFDVLLSSVVNTAGTATFDSATNTIGAGIVIINSSQTTLNEFYEGYYLALTDNKDIAQGSDFTSINAMYALSATLSATPADRYVSVPSTRLGFALSGDISTEGSKSVSETIEFIPTYNFGLSSYQDSLILSLFKVRNSTYEPDTLIYSLVESHIGSLNSRRLDEFNNTAFLQTKVNAGSPNLKLFVHPTISTRTDWSTLGSNSTPNRSVRLTDDSKALYAPGVFTPSYQYETNKEVGNILQKVERALTLVSTPDALLVDIIVDGGLSTVYATTSSNGYFDDLTPVASSQLTTENSLTITRWKNMFNTFSNFVRNVRKDCMFIADPLRQIFVNGNLKTLAVRSNTFTQNIYNPLKNLLAGINTNYAAIYGNWARSYDVFLDQDVWLPISGYAAAIYARTDQAEQPWVAPAGLNRGILNNVTDLGFNPNQKQRDFLYTLAINPVVFFSGDGYVIYGQKTLQNKPSAFDRVNVRRLFLILERSTQQALKYFVFEPNSVFTRTRLRNTITPIFELAKNTRGLYEYLIVCDERNNTPDVIDRNEIAVDIYIKPVKAAEFILVNFIATRTGQDFQELI